MENGFADKSICFFPLSIVTKENRSEKHAGCLCGHGYWFACSVFDADWRNLLESTRELKTLNKTERFGLRPKSSSCYLLFVFLFVCFCVGQVSVVSLLPRLSNLFPFV